MFSKDSEQISSIAVLIVLLYVFSAGGNVILAVVLKNFILGSSFHFMQTRHHQRDNIYINNDPIRPGDFEIIAPVQENDEQMPERDYFIHDEFIIDSNPNSFVGQRDNSVYSEGNENEEIKRERLEIEQCNV